MDTDYLVIGSGPAAMAAAKAIVSQGRRVTILDAGTHLDPARQQVVDRMASQTPEDWSAADLDLVTSRGPSSSEAIHSKTSFGSPFSFDSRGGALDVCWESAGGFNHSLARGGLTNVWGSSMLPYREKDLKDWPVCLADLEPHYRAVMEFVPCTRNNDALEEILPGYSEQVNSIRLSKQGESLLADLDTSADKLRRAGIVHGRARLAIRASDTDAHYCRYCTLCLSGCPYGLIYSSSHTLQEMIDQGTVDYRKDHFVEHLAPEADGVVVSGRILDTEEAFSIRARRVFLGAGVLPTASIVLNSLSLFDTPVTLLDSQYFIYPMLRLSAAEDVQNERMHTTSQVFVEFDEPEISDHLVHLQVYGYSSFLHGELNHTFLRWPLKSSFFRRQFLGRLMIAQGFIHSVESGSLSLTLKKKPDGGPCLSARTMRSGHTLATTIKIGFKLLANAFKMRTLVLLPGLQYPKPGSGYHSGGTFPMRANPGPLETDILGSLPSLARVHLVDSSIFPSIAATSITMTAMANAHRIATTAVALDPS
jgi:choline dehydrogenase-like flavoprotein